MGSSGWIKLHRSLLESSIWDSDTPFDYRSAWVDLLLMVNHEDKDIFIDGRYQRIRSGQKLTSVRKLSHRWHWGHPRVLKFLRSLEEAGMIYKDTTYGGTLVTIVNWNAYQNAERNALLHEKTYKTGTPRNTNENTNENASENDVGTQAKTQTFHKQECKEYIRMNKEGKKYTASPSSPFFEELE